MPKSHPARLGTPRQQRRAANKDGRHGIPSAAMAGRLTPTEEMGPTFAEIAAAQVAEEYAHATEDLYATGRELVAEIFSTVEQIADIEQELEETEAAHAKVVDGSGRHRRIVPAVAEWPVLAVIAGSEIALNVPAFAILPLSLREVRALAALVGLGVTLIAWGVARAISRALLGESWRASVKPAVLAVLGIPGLGAVVVALAELRALYLASSPHAKLLNIPLGEIAPALAALQAGLVVGAILVSAAADNPVAGDASRLRRHIARLQRTLEERKQRRAALGKTVEGIRARLMMIRRWHEAELARFHGFCGYLISVYRAALLRRHPQGKHPAVAKRPPVVIPIIDLPPDPWDDPDDPLGRHEGGGGQR